MDLEPILPVHWKSKKQHIEEWQKKSPEECLALTCKWRENFALRLDHYVSIDPDSPEAQEIVNQWDADGLLPATVSWRTARGVVRRLYKPIPGTKRMQIDAIKLDLRHGNKFNDIIPPSYVVDDSKGIKGQYEWVEGHDPDSIEVANLPEFVLEFFKTHSGNGTSSSVFAFNKNTHIQVCNEYARTITFEEPGRDNSLFTIALTLFKGGMKYPDTEYVISSLGQVCTPTFPEKDCLKKVESAFKRFQSVGVGSVADKVREWVSVIDGDISVSVCYSDLGFVITRDKASARQALRTLVEEGQIVPVENKRGIYRLVDKDMNRIKLSEGISQEEIAIKYPFHLQRYYRTMPKTVTIVSGEPDAGKTAWMLNFVHKNIYDAPMDIHYFTSEMGPAEMLDRASSIPGFDAKEWDKRLHIWERENKFEDVVFPNAINIIDFLEIHDEHWRVGEMIYKIWSKLNKGIAIIALQKDPAKDNPKGGISAREKPRLAITLKAGKPDKFGEKFEPNVMVIDKIKNWRERLHNPKGKEWEFKLINGCTFRTLDGESL